MPKTVEKGAPGVTDENLIADEMHRKRGRRSMAEMRAAEQTGQAVRSSRVPAGVIAATLGSRIKLARKRLGLSQQELAGEKYVASYISAIERDKIQPSLKALELIAQRLNEPVEYFLYGGYGSGAFQETGAPAGEAPRLIPETSFNLAVRDKLLEAQMLVENSLYQGFKDSTALLAQASALVDSLPRHQLTEYDRAQVGLVAVRIDLLRGQLAQVPAEVSEAISLAQRTYQPDLEIELNFLLGQYYSSRSEYDQAINYHKVAFDIIASNRDQATPELHLQVLSALVADYLAAGQRPAAIQAFDELHRLEDYYSQPQLRAELYIKLANFYREKNDTYRSRRFSRLALITYEQLNLRRTLRHLSAEVGESLIGLDRLPEAEQVLLWATGSIPRSTDIGAADLAQVYYSLAALRLRQANLDEARRVSRQSIEEANKAGDKLVEGKALRLAAEIENRLERPQEARAFYEQAIAILEGSISPNALGDVYKSYGEALSRWGDFETAVIYLKKAYDSKK